MSRNTISNQTSTKTPAASFASTPPPHFDRATYLMCSPQWYDVDYIINPWMAGNLHRPSRDAAFAQWKNLQKHLQRVADVRLIPARPGAPDMVFVAHGAVVEHGIAAISSFAHPQRQAEEQHLREWMLEHGFLIWSTPRETAFEGEGDVLFDPDRGTLWAGHGSRTCLLSHGHLANAWHTPVVSLQLVDPRFYHLDTCFAPLAGGFALYFPGAFDGASLARIEAEYPRSNRIVVSEAEATQFGCNVLNVGSNIFMSVVRGDLAERLGGVGFNVVELDLSEFLRGGASAKALALRISDTGVTHAAEAPRE